MLSCVVSWLKACALKVHLVDLAGSERVSRTKVEGRRLEESKFINQSLHYLEQVTFHRPFSSVLMS